MKDIIKSYDIRGKVPEQLNGAVAYEVGKRFVFYFKPKLIVVGNDMRNSSLEIKEAFIKGVTEAGCDVKDIGLVTTCMLYWGAHHLQGTHGVMITASHNPLNYNGIKFLDVKRGPIYKKSGILKLLNGAPKLNKKKGKSGIYEIKKDYLEYLKRHTENLKGNFVLDTMHGTNGLIVEDVFCGKNVSATFVSVDINGNIPGYASPNPTLEINQKKIKEMIAATPDVDMGFMWDGDADRLVVFDNEGRFVSPNFVTYLITQYLLEKNPGMGIVVDLRTSRMTEDLVKRRGGRYLETEAGNPYVKESMRKTNSFFGAETSGHYMFAESNYAEDSLIAAFYLINAVEKEGKKLSVLVDELTKKYKILPETNFKVGDYRAVFKRLEDKYSQAKISFLDGITIEGIDFRANIRASNTEPLVRLNLEASTQEALNIRLKEIEDIIQEFGGLRADH